MGLSLWDKFSFDRYMILLKTYGCNGYHFFTVQKLLLAEGEIDDLSTFFPNYKVSLVIICPVSVFTNSGHAHFIRCFCVDFQASVIEAIGELITELEFRWVDWYLTQHISVWQGGWHLQQRTSHFVMHKWLLSWELLEFGKSSWCVTCFCAILVQ